MQAGMTLTELAIEIERQASAKRDFVADTRQMRVAAAPERGGVDLIMRLPAGEESFGVQPNAHRQIAERVKIPAKYYDRMLTDAPDLLAWNVNHWLNEQPERRMLRTLDGNARAFLSERYRPLDNDQLLNAVLPVLAEQQGMTVRSCKVTDSRLYVQAVFPRLEGEVKKGDVVQSGLQISNSEIGGGALLVEPMLWRLVCLNGMVGSTAMRRHHVGGRAAAEENSLEIYRDETLQADDRAFWMKVVDTVRSSVDEASFNGMLTLAQQAAGESIQQDPVAAVEITQRQLGLTEPERGDVLRHLIDGGDLSRWGLANAITRMAHDADSYDRAVELERAGGNIIELPRNQWQEIAEAA